MDIHQQHKNTSAAEASGQCSAETIRCAFHPEHRYVIETANGHGINITDCGDSTEIFLQIDDNQISEASFVTTGCFGQVAAAEKLVETICGYTIAEALAVTPEQIDAALGHLPGDLAHCTDECCTALSKAVQDYLAAKAAPWKRIYG